MAVGDQVTLTIHDLAFGGDGVGRGPDGRVVFVPFTAEGDEVQVTIVEDQKRFCRGALLEVLTPGPGRAEPQCPYYTRCGGCQYQHLTVEAEQAGKAKQLVQTFQRLAKLTALPELGEPVVGPSPYGYRNKLVMHPCPEAATGEAPYGFVTTDSKGVIPIAQCPLAQAPLNDRLASLAAELAAADGSQETEARPTGDLVLRNPASGPPCSFIGAPPAGMPWLSESLQGKPVVVPPSVFWQVNPPVAEALTEKLLAWWDERPMPLLIDAYAGIGTFSLALGERVEQALLIELDRVAVRAARTNHEQWGLKGREFVNAPTEKVLHEAVAALGDQCHELTVILDPPRGGCGASVVGSLCRQPVAQIIYVSCNVATLARDLRGLLGEEGGYQLTDCVWGEMFPRTAHFEVMVRLARISPRNSG